MKLIFSYTVVITTAMPHPVCYTNVLVLIFCAYILVCLLASYIVRTRFHNNRIRVSNVHYYYELLARGVQASFYF